MDSTQKKGISGCRMCCVPQRLHQGARPQNSQTGIQSPPDAACNFMVESQMEEREGQQCVAQSHPPLPFGRQRLDTQLQPTPTEGVVSGEQWLPFRCC
mmetsp:Transcript_3546/g.6788  ORF Transcript_3546/g.6788 Transcript_3546/m.6788 type:complete len:98 (+) Transcript_3546:141-434(+)